MAEKRYRPFSCGTQYMDWCASNCERCTKADFTKQPTCEIDQALQRDMFGDGSVSEEIAERMGYLEAAKDGVPFSWPCGEVEWTEAWKAEVNARETNLRPGDVSGEGV